jgi:hypothetical protein
LNCSSVHSAATPYANASSRASGQKDFTKLSAWLAHAMGASVRKLRTFCGAPRSRSSKDPSSTLPPSCGSTMLINFWAAPLRSSSSFCCCSFSSPSVLICCRLFSIGDHLLQPLDVICTAIQYILHISKQLFFICSDFPKLCGEDSFQNLR